MDPIEIGETGAKTEIKEKKLKEIKIKLKIWRLKYEKMFVERK